MNLVIVESPAKGRTIEKYLGKDYKVLASFGHVRDLPKKELGVDTEHSFKPKYVIPAKARKAVSALKDAASKAETVYMATDYDREGEAIAWHVIEACKISDKIKRITFHEITKDAIQEAVKKPRKLDMDLVDAQQARRVLDRLVGYRLSPFLWHKVFKGLSAGRVQSVAVRLIVDREREIEKFVSEEYWTIQAQLEPKSKIKNQKSKIIATLVEKDNKRIEKLDIKSNQEAENIINDLEKAQYKITSIQSKDENRYPYPPFTTSTMQQEASKRLHYTAKKTMKLAQDLYEDGLITYMRTDSVSLATVAIGSVRKYIKDEYGEKYLPSQPKIYKTKSKGAQEAHEAIRPSYINKKPESTSTPSEDHGKLYDLIWRRTIACQMNPAKLQVTTMDIKAQDYGFRASGAKIMFDGFTKIWLLQIKENHIPSLTVGDILDLIELLKEEHHTEPPGRYTEASLIKALEEHGIGRPSTYAPTISTIQDRGYVLLDKKTFFPKDIGFIVTDILVKHFPDIVDLEFTASMEKDLDDVAEGEKDWEKMIREFYEPFNKHLKEKEKTVEKTKTEEKTDKKCSKCQKEMVIKMGKFGKFLACTGFPECKHTEQIIVKTGLKCPDCKDGDVIERKTRKGKTFWGCSSYPKCKWASWEDPNKNKN